MVGAIINRGFKIYQRKAANHTFINRWNEFIGHRTTFNLILKLKTLATLLSFYPHPNVAILTTATRLTYILSFRLGLVINRLLVGYLRSADVYPHTKLPL